MFRDSSKTSAPRSRSLILFILIALSGGAAGCSDDTPGVGTADMAAARQAAQEKGTETGLNPRQADVAPTRTRGKLVPKPAPQPPGEPSR